MRETGAPEVWITHGWEEALAHAAAALGIRARALALVEYEEEGSCRRAALARDRSVTYIAAMELEWDEAKSRRNLLLRGFDFTHAGLIFEGPVIEREDQRKDYREVRLIATGMADGDCLTVVYTPRAGRIRIISARRASKKERDVYRQAIPGSGPR